MHNLTFFDHAFFLYTGYTDDTNCFVKDTESVKTLVNVF